MAGGVELDEEPNVEDKTPYGSPSGLPVLEHDGLKMSQSIAIELYLASIAPKFASLTQQQQATDSMFCCICEDVLTGCAKVVFNPEADAKKEVDSLFVSFVRACFVSVYFLLLAPFQQHSPAK